MASIKLKSYRDQQFVITRYVNFEDCTTWGFQCVSGRHSTRRQSPCWPTKREALESARWHIDLWDTQLGRTI